ncbi:YjbH domain-containing protein [Chachezhania sediminis]|uniref:YjbH domain-containing protein n=1 Tax=Chachezhania sediminis TaxID=2599291 RepID=UPI001E291C17|nr:YjbH domain-containing protein [Chachezhania sediminis]
MTRARFSVLLRPVRDRAAPLPGAMAPAGPARLRAVALATGLAAITTVTATGAAAQEATVPPGGAASDWVDPTFTPLPAPSLNFYGMTGLMDMPGAEMMPDGQGALTLAYFGGTGRLTGTFQVFPWMMASFRYTGFQSFDRYGYDTYYDRSFDVRFRLLKESRYVPALTLGLQDFAGTGVYSGEYIVATKGFEVPALGQSRTPGKIKVTAGLGWGRLGSSGSIGSIGERPAFGDDGPDLGGKPATNTWFRGDYAPFAGVEWLVNDRFGVKAEYSSDAYTLETEAPSNMFVRRSSLNFGVEYQATERTRLGAYYMYGDTFGLSAQIQFNPKYPLTKEEIPAPQPITPRPSRSAAPEAWSTAWSGSVETREQIRTGIQKPLEANGLILEDLTLTGTTATLRFRDIRWDPRANAVGRAARVLALTLPASVETFVLIPVWNGMGLSAVTIRRSDLEALEFAPEAVAGLRAVTGIGEAPAKPGADAMQVVGLYPDFSWGLGPYLDPGYFDPDLPFRIDFGVQLVGAFQPAPGWLTAGTLRYKLAGNLDDGQASNSVLPHVRTDQSFYAEYRFTMNNLYAARYWRPGRNLYARVTLGYLEEMYGGISGELLWAPVDSPLALGLEVNSVQQRDFDQWFGFRDYGVATSHATAYLDMGGGYLAQVSAGRYLAGDVGATFSLERTFANGWRVGGFFTLTNVSADDFGEGSFDKGITFNIPVSWFLGKPSTAGLGTTIRPIQRDGGQMVNVPGRLYGQVRKAHGQALDNAWERVWQ